jgi:hypothetical protein
VILQLASSGGRRPAASNGIGIDRRGERAERVERFFNVPVIVAAVLSLPVIVIEETAVGDTLKDVAAVFNWGI